MTADRSTEARLALIFGDGLTAGQIAWLDGRVGAVIAGGPAGHQRPRRRLTRSLLLVGALLALAPTVFVATAGLRSTEAPYGMGDAAAYDAELQAAKAVTPIPPETTWPPYLDRAPDRNASYGTGLGTSMVEFNAYCLWLGYWYDAQDRGDDVAVATAVEALEQVRDLPSLVDPLTTDEGFRVGTQARIDAAIAGDDRTVLAELTTNCTGTWPDGE